MQGGIRFGLRNSAWASVFRAQVDGDEAVSDKGAQQEPGAGCEDSCVDDEGCSYGATCVLGFPFPKALSYAHGAADAKSQGYHEQQVADVEEDPIR